MTDRESVKEKIAKLMALAADGSGAADNEAETALRMAEKLMRRHGIELAEIQEATGQKPIWKWTEDLVPASWPKPVQSAPLWFGWIVAEIGKFTDTRVSYVGTRDRGVCAKFQGDEVDVEYALWLGHHIRTQIRVVANAWDAPGATGDERWANREEFRHSMAHRICDRMKALRAERTEAYRSTGMALVVIEDKIAQRDQQFGVQKYGSSKRSHPRGSTEAFYAGKAAGDKVQIHRPIEGGAKRKELT